jgi:GntP family gluconate:H+ symporter
MNVPFWQAILFLVVGIAVIVLLTAKFRVHAFFAIVLACLITGLGVEIPIAEIFQSMMNGFLKIMKSLGLIILLGTLLGVLLEHSGCTRVMANYILKIVGEKNATWAISLTGFVVGLPVFCDSGYIVLNSLNLSLARRTRTPIAIMSVSLATGLYAVHCLVPPHPGAAAAAGTIGVDIGKLMLYGILIAIPAMIVGHYWAAFAGKKIKDQVKDEQEIIETIPTLPSVIKSFLPILVPIVLIAGRSFFTRDPHFTDQWPGLLLVVGNPSIALFIGVLLALNTQRNWKPKEVALLGWTSLKKVINILTIIGAGGAFGAVLALTKMGVHFSQAVTLNHWGLLFPFVLTFIIKTAQGSSTVAIITSASILLPLLPVLQLSSEPGRMLAVLAMGAGSMMVSHTNDGYFWVISKFSGLDIRTTLKVYSMATVCMGITSFIALYILSQFI